MINLPTDKDKRKFEKAFLKSQDWITQDIKIPWSGYFEQKGKMGKLKFSNMQIEQGGGITGSGSDEFGSFILEGQISSVDNIRFIKQYSTTNVVEYAGTIDKGEISGTWHRSDTRYGGNFFLKMAESDLWSGVKKDIPGFTSFNNNIAFNMWICKLGIYGVGSDEIGQYVIKGVMENNEVKFVQSYHRYHEVRFFGHLMEEDGIKIVNGHFGGSSIEGEFILTTNIHPDPNLSGADILMKTMKDLVDGGPISPFSRKKISQDRLNGYTGPLTDRDYYSEIKDKKWFVHPGKSRWDHLTQKGQGSLKNHNMNINLPTMLNNCSSKQKKEQTDGSLSDSHHFDISNNISMLPIVTKKHGNESERINSDFLYSSEILATTGRRETKQPHSGIRKSSKSPPNRLSQTYNKPYLRNSYDGNQASQPSYRRSDYQPYQLSNSGMLSSANNNQVRSSYGQLVQPLFNNQTTLIGNTLSYQPQISLRSSYAAPSAYQNYIGNNKYIGSQQQNWCSPSSYLQTQQPSIISPLSYYRY